MTATSLPRGAPARTIDLLAGVIVAELGDEPAQIAGKVLADLGAEVTRWSLAPSDGPGCRVGALAGDVAAQRGRAWGAGKRTAHVDRATELADALRGADVVVSSTLRPGDGVPGSREACPSSVFVAITPYGARGPRAGWRGSDLTVTAMSGNLYATGDDDRPPLRCTEPVAYAHAAAEAVTAALTVFVAGNGGRVDVSLQEAAMIANLLAPSDYPHHGDLGRRRGSDIGLAPDIWACRDGYVMFGVRGGPVRAPTWAKLVEIIERCGLDATPISSQDWLSYNFRNPDPRVVDAVTPVLRQFFEKHSRADLMSLALRDNLMMAPVCGPEEVAGYEQLHVRGFLGESPTGGRAVLQGAFVRVDEPVAGRPDHEAGSAGRGPHAADERAGRRPGQHDAHLAPWAGLHILELGSGIAGPYVSRMFVEYGADCIRVESRTRPDMTRLGGAYPPDPAAPPLEGSALFSNLNVGKRSIALDMRTKDGQSLCRRLVDWADVVVENFRPGVMGRWGLGYEVLSTDRPDIVMVSTSMWGAAGPHSDYPGYGSQGSALSGYTMLTGWPDRAPCGLFPGAVTDSLGAVYGSAALASALVRRGRTGRGAHLDLSQIETALFTLRPWLSAYLDDDRVDSTLGNRSRYGAAPQGVFPCNGVDRWVAVAVWTDEDWTRLCALAGMDDVAGLTADQRVDRQQELEERLAAWTAPLYAEDVATLLQENGVEAAPVLDWADLHREPQLATREHFVPLHHPYLDGRVFDRTSARIEGTAPTMHTAPPTLGQHTDEIARDLLGLADEEILTLTASKVLF